MKQKLIFILAIITIITVILAKNFYNYLLDGRKCLDCPYEVKLDSSSLYISSSPTYPIGSYYTGVVTIETPDPQIKATGHVNIGYECAIYRYKFVTYPIIGKQYYTEIVRGDDVIQIDDNYKATKQIKIYDMVGNMTVSAACNYEIKSATGKLYIYGDRIR